MYSCPVDLKNLSAWMVVEIFKNKTKYIQNGYVNWDIVAAEVWNAYTGVFNEFIINDAIDIILEAASLDE